MIGANGAGKTTLIKHILGAHYAETGSVRVFGFDPVTHPVEVLSRIGYVSEDRDIPYWMRVQEIMNYTRSFFPKWDASFAEELREMFDLDPKQRIRTLLASFMPIALSLSMGLCAIAGGYIVFATAQAVLREDISWMGASLVWLAGMVR